MTHEEFMGWVSLVLSIILLLTTKFGHIQLYKMMYHYLLVLWGEYRGLRSNQCDKFSSSSWWYSLTVYPYLYVYTLHQFGRYILPSKTKTTTRTLVVWVVNPYLPLILRSCLTLDPPLTPWALHWSRCPRSCLTVGITTVIGRPIRAREGTSRHV